MDRNPDTRDEVIAHHLEVENQYLRRDFDNAIQGMQRLAMFLNPEGGNEPLPTLDRLVDEVIRRLSVDAVVRRLYREGS